MGLRLAGFPALGLEIAFLLNACGGGSRDSSTPTCELPAPLRSTISLASTSARIAAIETTMLTHFPTVSAGASCGAVWSYSGRVPGNGLCDQPDGGTGICTRHFDCSLSADAADESLGCDRAWVIVEGVPVDCQVVVISVAGERQSLRVKTNSGQRIYTCDYGSFPETVIDPVSIELRFSQPDGGNTIDVSEIVDGPTVDAGSEG